MGLTILRWAQAHDPFCSLHSDVCRWKGAGLLTEWRAMLGHVFHSFQAPGDLVHIFSESPMAPFPLAPSLPHLEGRPATSLLGLQTRCLLQLQPSLTLFPYSLAFILTTLFPATSGLLAAKANGLSFAECTALASPTWTLPISGASSPPFPAPPSDFLHHLLSRPLSVDAPWVSVAFILRWSIYPRSPGRLVHLLSTAGLGGVSFLCYLVPGKSRGLGLQHDTLDRV